MNVVFEMCWIGQGKFLAAAVVVRASSAEAVKKALARPEVATVVVPKSQRELLALDLTELTYG